MRAGIPDDLDQLFVPLEEHAEKEGQKKAKIAEKEAQKPVL